MKFQEFAESIQGSRKDPIIHAFMNAPAFQAVLEDGMQDQSDRLLFTYRSDFRVSFTLRDVWVNAEIVAWAAIDKDTVAVWLDPELMCKEEQNDETD